jgi:hypothetical protein
VDIWRVQSFEAGDVFSVARVTSAEEKCGCKYLQSTRKISADVANTKEKCRCPPTRKISADVHRHEREVQMSTNTKEKCRCPPTRKRNADKEMQM